MVTTIQPPKRDEAEAKLDDGKSGGRGGMLNVNNGTLSALGKAPSSPTQTGIWIGLATITMSFAAFTSALVVRQSTANDWHHLQIPAIVFLNTAVLLVSSGTLEVARRRVATFVRSGGTDRQKPLFWLGLTLFLGVVFVFGQYAAWLKLRADGLYLASNPNSSFFYVLTAMHALHVLGGLGGLSRVTYKVWQPGLQLRRSTMDATSYYWHFMGILWLYLLWIVWTRL